MPDMRIVTVTLNPAVDRVIEAPMFAVGKRVTGRVVAWFPTGRGITVSRVLAALGRRSIATGFVGARELVMFEEHLDRVSEGRAICQFLVVRARTRDNISLVDPVNDTETHIRDEGFVVQPDDVRRISSKLGMLARDGVIICFAGSLPKGLAPEAFRALVDRCVAQRARVVVNTADDALVALRGRSLWMLKLNTAQVGAMSGAPVEELPELVAAARSLTVAGGGSAECVLATRGADGAILITPEAALLGRVSVHPGRIVNTVGSGDSLIAGVIAKWTRSGDWTAALREGLAAATANAVGREAGQVSLEDVQEFREMTMIEPITPA